MLHRFGSIINYLVAIGWSAFGIIYLTKSSFMGYHSDITGQQWTDLSPHMQLLILALMRSFAGGSLACSLAMIWLQRQYDRERRGWMASLLLCIGLVAGAGSLYAQVMVRLHSEGKPPTFLVAYGMANLVLAWYLLYRSRQQTHSSHKA